MASSDVSHVSDTGDRDSSLHVKSDSAPPVERTGRAAEPSQCATERASAADNHTAPTELNGLNGNSDVGTNGAYCCEPAVASSDSVPPPVTASESGERGGGEGDSHSAVAYAAAGGGVTAAAGGGVTAAAGSGDATAAADATDGAVATDRGDIAAGADATVAAAAATADADGGDNAAATDSGDNAAATAAADADSGDNAADEEEPVSPELQELQRLWKPVQENNSNFGAWIRLIQHAETKCSITELRKVMQPFLARYPYCYGYWKKFVDLEKAAGNMELCWSVFEQGLSAVSLSVDLWLHYISYVRSSVQTAEGESAGDETEAGSRVRTAFQRAVDCCGLEFRSDRLWEQYCDWETRSGDITRALAIYERVLAVPTLSYRSHMDNLEGLVAERGVRQLLSPERYSQLRAIVLSQYQQSEAGAPSSPPQPAASDTRASCSEAAAQQQQSEHSDSEQLLPPGCDEPPESAKLPSLEEEEALVKDLVMEPLRALHKASERQVSLRWTFEETIRRPYFHVKPLEKAQLLNWKHYLDFEMEQGDRERVVLLFRRCLIACACYEEMWTKYINYLEMMEPVDVSALREVYQQACDVHLPSRPNIRYQWALFEERHGEYDTAMSILSALSQTGGSSGSAVPSGATCVSGPVLLQVCEHQANIARRHGDLEEADRLYQRTLQLCTADEQRASITVKYARFLHKVKGDTDKAEKVLRDAIGRQLTNQRLYSQLIDLGYQRQPIDTPLVLEAFRLAIESPMALREQLLFAQRRVEFVDQFCHDVEILLMAQSEHAVLVSACRHQMLQSSDDHYDVPPAPSVLPPSAGYQYSESHSHSTPAAASKRPASHTASSSEKRACVAAVGSSSSYSSVAPPQPDYSGTGYYQYQGAVAPAAAYYGANAWPQHQYYDYTAYGTPSATPANAPQTHY